MEHYPLILQDWCLEDTDSVKKKIFEGLLRFWGKSAIGPIMIAGISQYQGDSLQLLQRALELLHVDVLIPCVDENMLQIGEDIPEQSPLFHSHKILMSLSSSCIPQALQESDEQSVGPFLKTQLLKSHDFFDQAHDIAECIAHYHKKGVEKITVVAPERRFAEHLALTLGEKGILVNDSSAISLSQTLFGAFVLGAGRVLNLRCMDDYLMLLKHPWVSALSKEDVYAFEARFRSTPRVKHTLDQYDYPLKDQLSPLFSSSEDVLKILEYFLRILSPDLFSVDNNHAFLSHFEKLKGTLTLSIALHKKINFDDFMALLQGILDHQTISPPVPGGSFSVNIIGLMEARVSTSDLLIVTGLEEGLLPRMPPSDIWISPLFQKRLFQITGKKSIPSHDEWMGLQAQDFFQSITHATQVIVCCRAFDQGKPTTPSRFLSDLDLTPYTLEPIHTKNDDVMDVLEDDFILPKIQKEYLDAPCPLPSNRPTTLSVSAVELLLKDPYGFYAKYILKIYPLWHWKDDARALIFGQLLHQALDAYARNEAPSERDSFVVAYFQRNNYPLSLMEKIRVCGFCDWLDAFDLHACQKGESLPMGSIKTEHALSITYDIHGKMMEMKGILDRIDERNESNRFSFYVMDYKTGQIPSKKAMAMGYAPQLALCGLLVMENIKPLKIEPSLHLSYIHVLGKEPFGEEITLIKSHESIESAKMGLKDCFARYMSDDFSFHSTPNPWNRPTLNVYAHLARNDSV